MQQSDMQPELKQALEFCQYVINFNSLSFSLASLFLKTTQDVLSGINKLEGFRVVSTFRRYRDPRMQRLVDHGEDIEDSVQIDEDEYEIVRRNEQGLWESVPLRLFEDASREVEMEIAIDGFSALHQSNLRSEFERKRHVALNRLLVNYSPASYNSRMTSRDGTLATGLLEADNLRDSFKAQEAIKAVQDRLRRATSHASTGSIQSSSRSQDEHASRHGLLECASREWTEL